MNGVVRFFAILLFCFFSCFAKSQQIDSMMTVYAEGFPKEKMHIHFDRSRYNIGDTVWYKVYLLSANELSPLSKNLYVEWYDSTGVLIKQTVAPLFQSTAKGSFEIPATYKGSFLHVKAFTRWMLNDEEAYLYQRNIPINRGVFLPKKTQEPTLVTIFPEGGKLVRGSMSRMAFKATNKLGLPVKIKGYLVDDKNAILDSLKTVHEGMGILVLKPMPGVNYQVNWVDEYGTKGTTPVTGIEEAGAVLTLRANNEKAFVMIERSANANESYKQMNLLVHMNQQILYKVSVKMFEKTFQRAEIPIDELPTGVLQFSLFTYDWIPVAERIIFVNNHLHEFNAKVNPIYTNLDKRAKNSLEIVVSDTSMTNMSIAITDASILMNEPHTIFSDFLLSNELRGYIHNPAYYFTSDADTITQKLDLVMMTNGWRKYNWEKLKSGVGPQLKHMPEDGYLSLKGNVYGAKATSDLQLNFILAAKDSSKNMIFTPVNPDGSFEEKGLFFYDTVKVYYNFNSKSKITSGAQVKVENGLFRKEPGTQYKYSVMPSVWLASDSLAIAKMNFFLAEQERLRKLIESATLSEVIVKTKTKSKTEVLDETYASGMFSRGDGYSFDLTDGSVAAMDIFTYLQGRVAGLQINGMGASATLNWRGQAPDLYLNEMRSDVSMVSSVSVNDIAYVKVFRPPFFGGAGGGGGGAIVIYTKKGGEGNSKGSNQNVKGMESTILGGYSRFKEFYNPVYEKGSTSYELDSRSTLYWNPYVLTNKKAPRYKIEFYNNDVSKKLQVVVEGINAEGKMIRIVKMLE